MFLRRVLGVLTAHHRGVILPGDVARQEVNRAHSEKLWVWKQRRQTWVTTRMAARERGAGGGGYPLQT
jgi:3-hydroxymyristoyl/3-hydroxydecanoyl-(acyl carrier protein) dehydratase